MRTAYDFSPLYRSVIGFDRMADIIDSAMKSEGDRGYPPYDVEKTSDDSYRITLAAAGFAADELEVTTKPNLLIVTGHKAKEEDGSRTFLHRGIAARSFERRFQLADHVYVTGASLENGLLHVDLERKLPEALKPRQIPIAAASKAETKVIEAAAA